jgi:hypothetical protein
MVELGPTQMPSTSEQAIICREMKMREIEGYRKRPETQEYTKAKYMKKPLVRARVPYDPALVTGLAWISRFRTKTVATVGQMLPWGNLMPYWTAKCPCFNGDQLEDQPHILLECSRWHEPRQKYLSTMVRQISSLVRPERFTRTDRLALLLGGNTHGQSLPQWLLPRTDPYESDDDSDDDTKSEFSLSSDSTRSSDHSAAGGTGIGDIETPEIGSLQVAAYFTLVMRLRQRHLGEHPHWPNSLNGDVPPSAPRVNVPLVRTGRVLPEPSLFGGFVPQSF